MGKHLTRGEFNLWTLGLMGLVVLTMLQLWVWPAPWSSLKSLVFEVAGKIGGG